MQKKSKKRTQISVLQLKTEERQHLISKVQNFFKSERGEDLGLIAAEVILDFFLEDLGPIMYNKSLDDSKQWFSKMMNDVEFEFEQLYRETK